MTQTQEKPKQAGQPDYAPAGRGNFNPFLFLADGKSAEVTLDEVRTEETKDGVRTYLDVTLVKDAEGVDKDGKVTPFMAGEQVTILSAAIINNRMREAAFKLDGLEGEELSDAVESDKTVKWARFEGLSLMFTGQPSVTKKSGKGKGNPMRSLGVEFDRKFKPKA